MMTHVSGAAKRVGELLIAPASSDSGKSLARSQFCAEPKGNQVELQRFRAADRWKNPEIPEHLGGVDATRRLIRRCFTKPGELVLNLGCGSGDTACLLAGQFGLRVVAADVGGAALDRARERIDAAGLTGQITTVQMDIHALKFPAETFDAVIAGAALVAWDEPRLLAEVYRVLKRGRFFGANNLTFLKCPPSGWSTPVSRTDSGEALQPLLGEQWFGLLEHAGFRDVSATIAPLSQSQQFAEHVRGGKWRRFGDTVGSGRPGSGGRDVFSDRGPSPAGQPCPPDLGYGLYVGRKL